MECDVSLNRPEPATINVGSKEIITSDSYHQTTVSLSSTSSLSPSSIHLSNQQSSSSQHQQQQLNRKNDNKIIQNTTRTETTTAFDSDPSILSVDEEDEEQDPLQDPLALPDIPDSSISLESPPKLIKQHTHSLRRHVPRIIVKPIPEKSSLLSKSFEKSTDKFSSTLITPTTKNSAQASTMREVLASIPGFSMKPRRRSNKKMSTAAQIEQTKDGKIDLETPDSVLVGTNLRALLNKQTFQLLPPLYQHNLVQLLPVVDRPPIDNLDSSTPIRLSSSSLNNEFFARACLEWRERLAEGEFTPENQIKLKSEAEKEKSKLDPWKLKHFEPIWGEKGFPKGCIDKVRPSLKTTIKLKPTASTVSSSPLLLSSSSSSFSSSNPFNSTSATVGIVSSVTYSQSSCDFSQQKKISSSLSSPSSKPLISSSISSKYETIPQRDLKTIYGKQQTQLPTSSSSSSPLKPKIETLKELSTPLLSTSLSSSLPLRYKPKDECDSNNEKTVIENLKHSEEENKKLDEIFNKSGSNSSTELATTSSTTAVSYLEEKRQNHNTDETVLLEIEVNSFDDNEIKSTVVSDNHNEYLMDSMRRGQKRISNSDHNCSDSKQIKFNNIQQQQQIQQLEHESYQDKVELVKKENLSSILSASSSNNSSGSSRGNSNTVDCKLKDESSDNGTGSLKTNTKIDVTNEYSGGNTNNSNSVAADSVTGIALRNKKSNDNLINIDTEISDVNYQLQQDVRNSDQSEVSCNSDNTNTSSNRKLSSENEQTILSGGAADELISNEASSENHNIMIINDTDQNIFRFKPSNSSSLSFDLQSTSTTFNFHQSNPSKNSTIFTFNENDHNQELSSNTELQSSSDHHQQEQCHQHLQQQIPTSSQDIVETFITTADLSNGDCSENSGNSSCNSAGIMNTRNVAILACSEETNASGISALIDCCSNGDNSADLDAITVTDPSCNVAATISIINDDESNLQSQTQNISIDENNDDDDDLIEQKFVDAENYVMNSGEINIGNSGGM